MVAIVFLIFVGGVCVSRLSKHIDNKDDLVLGWVFMGAVGALGYVVEMGIRAIVAWINGGAA